MEGHATISILSLLLNADPVVKAVMAILFIASILSWGLSLETARRQFVVRRMMREARQSGLASDQTLRTHLADPALAAAQVTIPGETGGEFMGRLERTMREGVGRLVGSTDAGLNVVATIAAVSPFVGLFGTVWGVMNSFTAIAGANDTSLATVAPGIAEALFATALGLFAAIPAAIAYNRLGASRVKLGRMLDGTIRKAAEVHACERVPVAASPVPAGRLKVVSE